MEQRTLEEKRRNCRRLLVECDDEKVLAICHLIESGFFDLPTEEIKALINRVQGMTPDELQQIIEKGSTV